MKLSVVTITCRENPRLGEAGRTIAASLARTPDVELEWIIVDEKQRPVMELLELTAGAANNAVYAAVQNRLSIDVIAPPATDVRRGPNKGVAHNTARNAGLAVCDPNSEYVVFLNDCNLVTMDWVAVARDCADQGVGWRCKMTETFDMPVPADGMLKHKSHHDRFHVVPWSTVANACWGAPKKCFDEIHGFDLAYDGQRRYNDVEAILRMSRLGLSYITTERAFTLQLRRTKVADEVTTRHDVYVGARNQNTFNELVRSPARILPAIEYPWPVGSALVASVAPPIERDPIPGPPLPTFARGVGGGNHAAPAPAPGVASAAPPMNGSNGKPDNVLLGELGDQFDLSNEA
jgi:hypothetical protein